MKKIFSFVVLAGFMVGMLSGCGEDLAVNDMRICEFFTADEVAAIVGPGFITELVEDVPPLTQSCKYREPVDNLENPRNFNILVPPQSENDMATDEYEYTKNVWINNPLSRRETRDIEGVGDGAFWAYGPSSVQLIAYEGPQVLIVTLGHLDLSEEEQLEAASFIAERVFMRLKGE